MAGRGGAVATRAHRRIAALEHDCVELQASQDNQIDRDVREARELAALAGHVRRHYASDRRLMAWADWLLGHDTIENAGHRKQRDLAREISGGLFLVEAKGNAPMAATTEARKGNPVDELSHVASIYVNRTVA